MIAIFAIEYLLTLPSEQQSSNWYVIYAIQMGLGDGVEWIGGIWLAVLSWHLFNNKKGQPAMSVFGFIVGCIGCLTIYPSFSQAGAVFGLAQIVWFCWLSKELFRLSQLKTL